MKGFYKALKICTFCAPLPNSNRCWASFQTDQWHGYQCLFICISSWTQMMSDWSGRDFFDNIFLVWVLFILGADGGETLEKINSPKPLLESINFNALGNIFDSQHKTSRRNKKFLHSQNNFILRNTFFMSWCTMLTPLVIRSLSALSNYFIFFLTIKYYSNNIWVIEWKFTSTRVIKGTLETQSSKVFLTLKS